MGFVEAVRTCMWGKYLTFSGRASRSEYWWFYLFSTIMSLVIDSVFVGSDQELLDSLIFSGVETYNLSPPLWAVYWIVNIALFIPGISVLVRRLHDRDMSAWWILGFLVLLMIPVANILAIIGILVSLCLKGTEGPNRFGPDPLNPVSDAHIFE